MTHTPLVTIGIPNFNYGCYLQESVGSALEQDYPNLEVLVSDNASTDDSVQVLAANKDSRLRWWRNSTNVGVFPNWDLLVKAARGEYFKILQSDDTLEPSFVSRAMEAIQAHGADAAFTGFRAFGNEHWELLPRDCGLADAATLATREQVIDHLEKVTAFVQPTAGLFRSTLVPEGFGGDSRSMSQDMVYWAKAVTRGRPVFLNEVLANQRFHPRQDRRRRDTSRGLREMLDALELLAAFDGSGQVEKLARRTSRTYARSMLANVARGRWCVAGRIGAELVRRKRLAGSLRDSFRRIA